VSVGKPARLADAIFALGAAALSAAVYFGARDLPESPFDPLGPAAFPLALAALLACLAAIQIVRLAFGLATGASDVVMVHGLGGDGTHRPRVGLAAAVYAMTVGYAVTLALGVGFLVPTSIYVAAVGAMLAGRERRDIAKAACVGALAAVAVWSLFTNVFLLQWP
jgi:hypothetical protein